MLQDWAGLAAGSGHSNRFPPADSLCVKVMAALLDKKIPFHGAGNCKHLGC